MFKARFTILAALLLATAGYAEIDPSTSLRAGALSLVPADAVSVGVVKLSELRRSPLSATLFEHTDEISTDGEADKFLTDAGLAPAKDIDLLVVATSPVTRLGTKAEVLVLAEGRFNVERLTKALVTRGAIKKNGYFTLPEVREGDHHGAVAFAGSTLAILGSESAVTEALQTRAKGGSAFAAASLLGHDAARIDPSASAWAIVDVTRAARLVGGTRLPNSKGQGGEALAAAIRSVSTVALWATDTGDSLKLGAFGLANDEETLALLEDTLRGALAAMRLAVKDKSPDLVPVLRKFQVERTDDSIRISGSIPAESLRKLMAHKHAAK
jgi:hypothetical protein